jgi:hypothetical protein
VFSEGEVRMKDQSSWSVLGLRLSIGQFGFVTC